MKNFNIILLLIMVLYSCNENTTDTTKEATTIDELVKNAGYLTEQPSEYSKTEIGSKNETSSDGMDDYISNSKQFKLTNKFDEISAFSSAYADVLYPGSIIQGKDILEGKLSPITSTPRTPITLVLQGGSSELVANPNNANVTNAIRNILQKDNPKVANMVYNKTELFSGEQAFLELGLNISWLPGQLSAKFQRNSDFKKNSIFLYFKQVYYTISIDNFSKPSSFFETSVTPNDLKSTIYAGNPPCIISSVSYGRIIMVKITSEQSIQVMKSGIEASLVLLGNGSAKFDKSKVNFTSSFDAVIVGGSAQGAAEAVTNSTNLDKINELIQKEAEFSNNNPGFPIAYTVRYLNDNTPVKLGKATEYYVPNWTLDPNQFFEFDVDLSHFNIIDDGNSWTDGKFYYEINLIDKNGDLLTDGTGKETTFFKDRFNYTQAGDGERVNVAYSFKGVKVRKKQGEQFTIRATLHDYFESGNDVKAGVQGGRFDYPTWQNIDTDFIKMPLIPESGNYNTEFVFRVVKK